jgi:hypothetical protein
VEEAVEELEGFAWPALVWAALIGLALTSCGYAPVYVAERPETRLSVFAAPPRTPDVVASQAVLAGARSELSAAGVLASSTGYPRLVIELSRIDERSLGIRADSTGNGVQPLARGSAVGVVGRAWVEEAPGAPPSRDTGDMRRAERFASASDPVTDTRRDDATIAAAARRLGRALARRVLGYPEPADEAP